MKKNNIKATGKILFSLSVALLLSGCEMWELFSSKFKQGSCCSSKKQIASTDSALTETTNGSSKVLATINGKPFVTEDSFNEYYNQFIAANPRMQAMIQFMPNAKQEIFNGMMNERLLLAWGDEHEIQKSSDYQKELEQGIRMIKMGLAAKQFEKDIIGKITVTDAQMHEYYDAHKDPELIAVPGGVKAQGVVFDTENKAQAFLEVVKGKPADFKKLAGKEQVKEFTPITSHSFDVDKKIKDKVLELKKYPQVIMIQAADNKYWVIAALEKQETQYRSFDEVKEGIKQMLEREKAMKIYTDKLAELKKEYKVVVDESFFAQQAPEMPMMMPGMQADDAGHNGEAKNKTQQTA